VLAVAIIPTVRMQTVPVTVVISEAVLVSTSVSVPFMVSICVNEVPQVRAERMWIEVMPVIMEIVPLILVPVIVMFCVPVYMPIVPNDVTPMMRCFVSMIFTATPIVIYDHPPSVSCTNYALCWSFFALGTAVLTGAITRVRRIAVEVHALGIVDAVV